MPRNGSGTYTLPAGNPVSSGTLIDSAWANSTLTDLASAMTDSLSRTGSGGMTAPLRFTDGTVSAPGIAWTNETSSGFYRAGASDFRMSLNGVDVATVTSTGLTVTASKTLAALGNATVAGTLGVTGVLTATGGVAGNVTGNVAGNVTGNVTGNVAGQLNGSISSTTTATTQTSTTNNTTVATTAFVQSLVRALHPVGSIYINATSATNPATLFGFGTWVAFGAGRVPVGFDSTNAQFDTAEETGGSYDAVSVTHTHTATSGNQSVDHTHTFSGTTSNAGSHSHTSNATYLVGGGGSGFVVFGGGEDTYYGQTSATINSVGDHSHTYSGTTSGVSATHNHAITVNSAGSSGTNANVQPYITVYMWKRTA